MSQMEKTKVLSKDFILFFIVIAQASFGTSISVIILAFLVLKITGSPSAMALTLGLRVLPTIFMPFIATLLDRVYVKVPLILSFFLRGLLLILLYIGVHKGLIGVQTIYLVALTNGILATITMPSCQIIIPNLVGKSNLERGNSILNISEQSMSLMGFLVGGILVSLLGPVITILFEGISYILASIFVILITIKKEEKSIASTFLYDLFLGLKIMKDFKVVAIVTLMCFFINVFFAAIEVYLPLHMKLITKGAAGYGIFMSSMTIGMLISSFFIAMMGIGYKNTLGIVIGWVSLGIAFLGLGVLNSFYFCLLWGAILGVGVSLINISIRIILQKTINYHFRGRVNGISVSLSSIGMPIAFIIISYTIHTIDFREIFVVGAFFAIVFSVIWFLYVKTKPTDFFKKEFIVSNEFKACLTKVED